MIDIEISRLGDLDAAEGLDNCQKAFVIARLHGRPIGYVTVPVFGSTLPSSQVLAALANRPRRSLLHQILFEALGCVPARSAPSTKITVAVCTRGRPADLEACLHSLRRLDYPDFEILIVDNAPEDNLTRDLVTAHFPEVHYVCEPRPGLDWARNRAVIEAGGEILAFTDDDVRVDPGWLKAVAQVFDNAPDVMAVTGLIAPLELEAEAQELFESNGGFGRGFLRRWCRIDAFVPGAGTKWFGAGQFGAGANMAYRRSVFAQIGLFDPALDVGTATNGGGDIEMMFRVIKSGHTLVYEPAALVRHRHRRTREELSRQLRSNSSFFPYAVRAARTYPDETRGIVRFCLAWYWQRNIKRYVGALRRPMRFPKSLIVAEMKASVFSAFSYDRALSRAVRIAATYGPQCVWPAPAAPGRPAADRMPRHLSAVRLLHLDSGCQPVTDVASYAATDLSVHYRGRLVGQLTVENEYAEISALRLFDAVCNALGPEIAESLTDSEWQGWRDVLRRTLDPTDPGPLTASKAGLRPASTEYPPLGDGASVTVVIPVYRTNDALEECLLSVLRQQTARNVDILVVVGEGAAGRELQHICKHPCADVLQQRCLQPSALRNAGIAAARGDIVALIDPDVVLQNDWLEMLAAPFSRSDVALVTGAVLPPLRAPSHLQMPVGNGAEPLEMTGRWFNNANDLVECWRVGSFANMALRKRLLEKVHAGPIDEALGPQSPGGGGDDAYLVYRTLKAGFTVLYQPSAQAQQVRTADPAAFVRAMEDYWRSRVALLLTMARADGDPRAAEWLLRQLPGLACRQLAEAIRSRSGLQTRAALAGLRGMAKALLPLRGRRQPAPRAEVPAE